LEQREEHGLIGLRAEYGWTLTKAAPNSSLARSIAVVSTSSTNSRPP
jgi:hypothetical protein